MGVNQRIAGRQRFEFIGRRDEWLAGNGCKLLRHAHRVLRMRI